MKPSGNIGSIKNEETRLYHLLKQEIFKKNTGLAELCTHTKGHL